MDVGDGGGQFLSFLPFFFVFFVDSGGGDGGLKWKGRAGERSC